MQICNLFLKNLLQTNFLDINLKTINSKLHFDVYREPTNYFSYLHSKSCHPPYMKNNITLSVARRIVRIVTDNKSNRLQELKDHLIEKIIDCSFIKLFQTSKFKTKPKRLLPSLELTILDINFASTNWKIALKNTANREVQKTFNKKNTTYYTTTKKLWNMLVRTKWTQS